MALRLVSCLLLFAVGSHAAAVPKCHTEILTACGEPLNQFRKEIGQKFPTTEEHLKNLCTRLDEAAKCVDDFKSQCMTPIQLEMFTFLTEGAYAVYKEFCTAGSELREDYLEHAECINSAYESDEFKDIASYVEAGLEQLVDKPQEEKLATACCGYQWMDKNMKNLGKDKCGQDAVDAFDRVTRMAVSTLPEVLCQGFQPESQECTKVLPPPGTKPTGNLRNSHIAKSFSELYLQD